MCEFWIFAISGHAPPYYLHIAIFFKEPNLVPREKWKSRRVIQMVYQGISKRFPPPLFVASTRAKTPQKFSRRTTNKGIGGVPLQYPLINLYLGKTHPSESIGDIHNLLKAHTLDLGHTAWWKSILSANLIKFSCFFGESPWRGALRRSAMPPIDPDR